jgi:hypothetical protein
MSLVQVGGSDIILPQIPSLNYSTPKIGNALSPTLIHKTAFEPQTVKNLSELQSRIIGKNQKPKVIKSLR